MSAFAAALAVWGRQPVAPVPPFSGVSMGAGACLYELGMGERRGESPWPLCFCVGWTSPISGLNWI